MNNKMAKIHIYQQLNLKSKQEEQRQKHGYREHFDGCHMGGCCGAMGEEVRGLRSTYMQLQNSHRDVKYSIRNGVATELIHMTHRHEQWWWDCVREWGVLGGGGKGLKSGQL